MKLHRLFKSISLFLIITSSWQQISWAEWDLLRARAAKERVYFGLFNKYGIALDAQAERESIEQYQKAINEVIEWAKENGVDINRIKTYGSLSRLKTKLPRLGIYRNILFQEALSLLVDGIGPSDLDIAIPAFPNNNTQNIHDFQRMIFEKYGILLHIVRDSVIRKIRSESILEFKDDRFVISYGSKYKLVSAAAAAAALTSI